jgi:hypothetical protein
LSEPAVAIATAGSDKSQTRYVLTAPETRYNVTDQSRCIAFLAGGPMAEWTVDDAADIDIDETVHTVDVRLVGGHVDVVATDGPARVEVSGVEGPPIIVRATDGRLSVAHEDVRGGLGILGWLRASHERRRAIVSVAVPAGCTANLAVVTADAVLSGLAGGVKARSVSGEVVLAETAGEVRVESVSGDVEARSVSGDIALKTVSGGLTVVDGSPAKVHARNISGDVVLDVRTSEPIDIDITTVSGDVTVRLPDGTNLDVDVLSTSGDVACAFDGLEVESRPGSRRLSGRLGAGNGGLRGRTVSGSVALLVREPA